MPRGDVRLTKVMFDWMDVRCRASSPDVPDTLKTTPPSRTLCAVEAPRETVGAGWADVDQNAVSTLCEYGIRSSTLSKAA